MGCAHTQGTLDDLALRRVLRRLEDGDGRRVEAGSGQAHPQLGTGQLALHNPADGRAAKQLEKNRRRRHLGRGVERHPELDGELGEHYGAGLTEREVRYFVDYEWARGTEDVLWRRSKAGLRLDAGQRARVRSLLGA